MIENMNVMAIIEQSKKYESVVLYGAGVVADELSCVLESEGIYVSAVIVSEKGKDNNLNGIPIYAVDDYRKNITDDVFVITAVTDKYKESIVKKLQDLDISNFICASDYEYCNGGQSWELKVLNAKEYGQWWEEFQNTAKRSSIIDLNIGKNVAQNGKKQIVLLGIMIMPRLLKMAKAISESGYQVHLLISKNTKDPKGIITALSKSDICIARYSCYGEVIAYCKNCNASILHIFAQWGNKYFLGNLMGRKIGLPPIIYDVYDTANGMVVLTKRGESEEQYEQWLEIEKFCFENADGICSREFSWDYLHNERGLKMPGKKLRFLDYYDVRDEVDNEVSDDEELRLCYIGGLDTERMYHGSAMACFLEFANLCAENKCHFYVYSRDWNPEAYIDYIELDKNNEYFHFCKPLPFEELCTEIGRYDYGVYPVKKSFRNLKGMEMGTDGRTKAKYSYAGTNKYFDYLQSGLPVVAGVPVKLIETLAKEKLAINWCLEDFDFDELRRRKKEMKENVRKNRHKFSIQYHIQELVEFYEDLMK